MTTSTAPGSNSYDLVPYESHPFDQTHPDRLATVATLFGLRPAPVQRCRVLELGSAAGGNLIPMAEQLPDSQFVGIDLSAREIGDGQTVIDKLGLKNIELRHASIADVDDSYGKFDYILCHGVFSWVPTEIQNKIFQIAARQLNPQGVVYVSYNTYPGWHMRGLIRAMMRYHAENFANAKVRTRQARALLDFLASSVSQDGGAYATLLRQELEVLCRQSDSYLFHEHLEDVNDPLFFHQFIERAAAHGLQYLGESRVGTMILSNFQRDVEKTLRMLATDQVQAEQYMDFLRNRTFRETLLCPQTAPVSWGVNPESLRRLFVASRAELVPSPAGTANTEEATYQTPTGYSLTTSQPLLKAALKCLREAWPRFIPFDQLRVRAREQLGGQTPETAAAPEDQQVLALGLLNAYLGSDLVEFHSWPGNVAAEVSARPVASPYARLQVQKSAVVTSRRHEVVRLSPFQFLLLPLLDGQHERSALVEKMVEAVLSGRVSLQKGEEEIREAATVRAIIPGIVEQSLAELVWNALLVG